MSSACKLRSSSQMAQSISPLPGMFAGPWREDPDSEDEKNTNPRGGGAMASKHHEARTPARRKRATPLPGAPDVACRNADTGSDRRPAPRFVRQWGGGNPGCLSGGCPSDGHVNCTRMDTEFLPRFRPSRDGSLRPACLIWNYMVGVMFTKTELGKEASSSRGTQPLPGLSRALLFSLPSYASFSFCVYLLLATCPALLMDSCIGMLSCAPFADRGCSPFSMS